jgi:hypothetical protein
MENNGQSSNLSDSNEAHERRMLVLQREERERNLRRVLQRRREDRNILQLRLDRRREEARRTQIYIEASRRINGEHYERVFFDQSLREDILREVTSMRQRREYEREREEFEREERRRIPREREEFEREERRRTPRAREETRKEVSKESIEKRNEFTCKMCNTEDIAFIILPCKHVTCESCQFKLTSVCEICGKYIEKKLKLYLL